MILVNNFGEVGRLLAKLRKGLSYSGRDFFVRFFGFRRVLANLRRPLRDSGRDFVKFVGNFGEFGRLLAKLSRAV